MIARAPYPSVLITGAGGLLAPYLIDAVARVGHIYTTARTAGTYPCDLSDLAATRRLIEETSPALVLHAAGMTDVDACEHDPEEADRANRAAAANLSQCLSSESRFVYISTDQVYPDVAGPHVEGTAAPINVYGKSKLAGEDAVLAHNDGLVARTNFFAESRTPGKHSLSDFIVENLSCGQSITLFSDALFSPLHATSLAAILVELAQRDVTGIYNVASRNGTSKAEFALGIAKHLGLQTDSATLGESSCLPGRVPRAHDLRMNPGKVEALLRRTMPTLEEEIQKL